LQGYLAILRRNFMAITTPRFPATIPTFHIELKKRVNAYFHERKIKPTGNWRLHLKTAIIVFTFVATYLWLVFFTPSILPAVLLCILMGINVAAVGFNIMHDGAHGSYSKNSVINQMAASSLDIMGASSFLWKTKHNIIHHTYTNIDGVDDDIDVRPWLRLAPAQKRYSFHRFQHFYFLALYAQLYLFWVFFRDFKKYFAGKIGNIAVTKRKRFDEFTFWGSKVSFLIFFIVLPIYMVGIWRFLPGFFIFLSTCGIIISVVFQLAHAVDDVEFLNPNPETDKMKDEWAVHQVKTTANFATKNKIVTWFVGGLNFQIEHHLFPRISHIHYPAVSKIVKQTAQDFGIKYKEFPNLTAAIYAHVVHLRKMGMAE
jgi:linoleoyl-CoA desaturase